MINFSMLRNLGVRIIAGFIPISYKRKEFREKYLTGYVKIDVDKSNNINIPKNRNIKLKIKGKNNTINISPDLNPKSVINIFIHGDNNTINIGKAHILNLNLFMGVMSDDRRIYNSKFIFGNTYSGAISVIMMEDNTKVDIGDDGMFSNNIEIRCTDDHTVVDLEDNVINKASDVTIGNHVWLCKDVTILKNTAIPDNCIVGAKSVVAKRFDTPNCAICGNSAKIVKTGINWNGERPDRYNKKGHEKPVLK